jgi:hypothetical protein
MASSISLQRIASTRMIELPESTRANSPLLVVDTGEVAVDDGVVGGESESPEIGSHRSVKDPCLLQNIAKIDVGIQERWV